MEAQRIADHQSILLNLRYPTLRAPNRTPNAMIRTLTFALRRDPDTSRAIGHHATQQNLAYNHAVDVLNREPHLPKRSGKNHPDALNKRITAWRQANRQKAVAPYYIHQEGGEQAWEANQRLQEARAARLKRIAQAEALAKHPSTATSAHIAAPWLITTANTAASASPSPTGGSFRSATTERPSPAASALSPSRFAPTGTSNSWTYAPYNWSP